MALYTPEQLAERLGPLWQKRMRDIVAEELNALGVSPSWDVINPLIETHLQEFGLDRLSMPIDTSRGLVVAQITEGVNAGEGIPAIAKRLLAVGATDQGYRARLIAQTEIVRSANMGRLVSWKASGLPGLKKRWLSSFLPTTRASHAALHNTIVGLDEQFEFNAALEPGVAGTASVPGEASHPAHACNCHCSSTAFDPEHGKAIEFGSPEHIALCKSFDDEVVSWERAATPLIVDFYEDIETETLRILGVDKDEIT